MTAQIFLSIRPVKSTGQNRYKIIVKKRKIDKNELLYYKYITTDQSNKKMEEMHRLMPSDVRNFITTLQESLKSVQNPKLLFFIHGYHPFQKKLHVNLLQALNEYYGRDSGNSTLDAIIFFSWPNRGVIWKEDDEAYYIGEILAKKYWHLFEELSDFCKAQQGALHMMCQSFGHHILNSFTGNLYRKKRLFDKIFLMAADIPFKCMRVIPPGIKVKNKIGKGPEMTHYNLSNLDQLGEEVHVFYDPHDMVLEASSRNFLSAYKRLGKKDPKQFNRSRVIVHDNKTYASEMHLGEEIYNKLPNLRIAINSIFGIKNKFNRRHQYFYSNSKVVSIIKGLI